MGSLEERVLRVFYEGECSAQDCAAEIRRQAEADEREISRLLEHLVQHAYLAVHPRGTTMRYSLTPHGSERLATLVE
jgi:DNA-binding IclR family transcriptional regulator